MAFVDENTQIGSDGNRHPIGQPSPPEESVIPLAVRAVGVREVGSIPKVNSDGIVEWLSDEDGGAISFSADEISFDGSNFAGFDGAENVSDALNSFASFQPSVAIPSIRLQATAPGVAANSTNYGTTLSIATQTNQGTGSTYELVSNTLKVIETGVYEVDFGGTWLAGTANNATALRRTVRLFRNGAPLYDASTTALSEVSVSRSTIITINADDVFNIRLDNTYSETQSMTAFLSFKLLERQ